MGKQEHRILVAQLGARNHYTAPMAFHKRGFLTSLYTDFYLRPSSLFGALVRQWSRLPSYLRPTIVQRAMGRIEGPLPPGMVKSFDLTGIGMVLGSSLIKKPLRLRDFMGVLYGSWFCHLVVRNLPSDITTVYAFNSAALELFEWAHRQGIRCVLEQVSAPRQKEEALTSEEYSRWPGWERNRKARFVQQFAERERREWEIADLIVTGSHFAADGLVDEGVCPSRIRVIPYGLDSQIFNPGREGQTTESRPLRILFAGAVKVAKGVQYLYESLDRLNPQEVEVKIVGPIFLTKPALAKLKERCNVPGVMPRLKMPEVYRWADVLVFPSICEGYGLVTHEAMAMGLPVITTENAKGIVRDGIDGYIVPIREPDALADRIQRLVSDIRLRQEMAQNALERARQEGSLERYEDRLVEALVSSHAVG